MDIIVAMAGIAFGRCFPVFFASYMAFFARYFLVFTAERVVGLVVVELLFVKQHNLGIAPLVVGMAHIAGLRLEPSVMAGPGAHVRADFLVTAHAKSVLRLAVELDVTLRTLVF